MKKTVKSLFSLVALFLICAVQIKAQTTPSALELRSPRADDHFEVTKPVFCWKSLPTVQKYQLYVDDAQVGTIPASPNPVMSFSPEESLTVGPHHWYVKGLPATGDAIVSGTLTFTVDPSRGWPAWAIGPFQRYGANPIIHPHGDGWEAVNTYNPGVLFDNGKFRMLYRGQGQVKGAAGIRADRISRVGYAEGIDGVTFTENPNPIIDAVEPFEQKYGCEDARFFKCKGTYYTFYTGAKPRGGISLCEATSPDGTNWTKLGVVVEGTKNGAMVCDPNGTPVQINGKYCMFVGDSGFGICYSDDLVKWSPKTVIDMKLPAGWVKPYEPCVAVTNYSTSKPDDIVLFIAGTLNGKGKWFYGISETLFSKSDLTKKVDQLDDCIMTAREPYESGTFRNCLWMNCIIQHDNEWMMYYGAGDRNVGLATAPVIAK